jgi:hypothetical protein
MPKPSQRRRRVVRTVAPAVGLLTAALLVWQGSYEAFSATTTSPGNSWAAGTVALTNDTNAFASPTGVAAFTVTKMVPGSTGVKCIVVKSTTNVPSTGKLYLANEATTLALDSQLNIQVDVDYTHQDAACAGFVSSATIVPSQTLLAAKAAFTGFASGAGVWAITGTAPEYTTYRITYTLSAAATNAVEGGTANADFVWEADSN